MNQPTNHQPIQEFLELYNKERTVYTYQSGVRAFLDCVYDRPRVKARGFKGRQKHEEYEALARQYLSEDRDIGRDLLLFAAMFKDKPPYTARIYMTAVREFLDYHGIELSKRELKNVRRKMPKGKSRTTEKIIDTEILQSLFHQMDTKGRAFFLLLTSSGTRIGEALQLELDDIDLQATPCKVTIRQEYTKNSEQRITFISDEARSALKEWLKIRQNYLESSINRNSGLVREGISKEKSADDSRIFPFAISTASTVWKTALKNAELASKDRNTDRIQIRPHSLRKFFRSQAALHIPVDVVEAMMGHEGYLTGAYRRYSDDQMATLYRKAEQALTVFVQEDRETKNRVEHLEAELTRLKEENQAMRIAEQSAMFQKLLSLSQDQEKLDKLLAVADRL